MEDTSTNKNVQFADSHLSHDIDMISKIFPRGFDLSKEHIGRGIASRIGYNNLYDMGKGTIEEVNINSIYPCQQVINKTKIIELILYIKNNEVPGYPIGLKIGEDIYLLDGHHRVSAQILSGRKTVMIHLTTLSEDNLFAETTRQPIAYSKEYIKQEQPKQEEYSDAVRHYIETTPKVFNKEYFRKLNEIRQMEAKKKQEESE